MQLLRQEFFFRAGGCGDLGCHWLQVIGRPEEARSEDKTAYQG